ncbi:putative Protein FAM210B, mitochondrial [Nannochloris sp. 'desiccata']|nr:hypothetical protein KSW81_000214 [Chlorella desiccata (nom. nud.)]KAH7620050.1 putative Protein FAM210B, mitochondrial [Chlorella desiccata (nom. nud.)]
MHSAVAAQKPALGISNYKCAISTPRAPNFTRFPRLALKHSGHTLSRLSTTAQAAKDKEKITDKADATTRKFGLEAGLWEVFRSQNNLEGKTKGEQAKELLKKYGSAYLITSISFALVSFAACYALVASGVDVGAVLAKFGLQVTDTSEKVGTFAIAYAAHKALSPVRFPPAVALTPAVAKWLGKDVPQGSSTSSRDGGGSTDD